MADTPVILIADSGDSLGPIFAFSIDVATSTHIPWGAIVQPDGLGGWFIVDTDSPLNVTHADGATSENQEIIISELQDIENLLTTIETDLDQVNSTLTAIETDTTNIANSLALLDDVVYVTGAASQPLTDKGVGIVYIRRDSCTVVTAGIDDGDFVMPATNKMGVSRSDVELRTILDDMDATTGWTVLNDDAASLATTANHIQGTAALSFAKVNGTANTVAAVIQKTVNLDLSHYLMHDLLQSAVFLSSIADVAYVLIRLGTDASNYNEWRIAVDNLTAGVWNTIGIPLGSTQPTVTGNGWDQSAVTWMAVGVAFDGETDTLAGIRFDHLSILSNAHVNPSITVEVTAPETSNQVTVRAWGSQVDTNIGNASSRTLRVVTANNDPGNVLLASIDATLSAGITATFDGLYDEDSPHLTGDKGMFVLVVRRDIASAGAANGDYSSLNVDQDGLLWTHDPIAEVLLEAIGTALTVDGVLVTIDGISASLLIDTHADDSANTADALRVGSYGYVFDSVGGNWDRMPGNEDDGVTVNLGVNNDIRIVGSTTGGATPGKLISAASTNATVIKASTGTLKSLVVMNNTATMKFFKLYNKATAPSEADTPVHSLGIPGNAGGGGFAYPMPPEGIAFGSGISFRITGAAADSDTTAVGANEVVANYSYF